MSVHKSLITIALPDWFAAFMADQADSLTSVEARMDLAIRLARVNVDRGTGGPFGAVVCDAESGRLIAAGVNVVTSAHCSIAHAEMVALALAQQALGNHILAGCELTTSTEPCAMCLGAIPWSGVESLVCGARGADAEAIEFDEGDKPTRWLSCLERRGVRVTRDVLREKARAVLLAYRQGGGEIY